MESKETYPIFGISSLTVKWKKRDYSSEEFKKFLFGNEELVTNELEDAARLYFTGPDFTINLIPVALVSAAVLGCE